MMHGLMALVAPNREKPMTPARSMDLLIHEKNITFMSTTDECREKQALRRQWFAGVRLGVLGGMNQGLLPMTIK
jgi:hypothetical protein